MKELKDYTYNEIRDEYFRRRRIKFGTNPINWSVWEAKIVGIEKGYDKYFYHKYKYIVEPIDDVKIPNISKLRFKVNQKSEFKIKEMPMIGDIVLLRYRKHINGIDYPDESKIIEIIKRKEDVD